MQIRVNLKIFIFIFIFFLTGQVEIYGILMLFAFLHEMGHMICGLLLGLKPKELLIMPFGLSIAFHVSSKDYNKKIRKANVLAMKRLFIALAGPITNLLIIIVWTIFDFNLFQISKEVIIYSNILIGLFNLIPIYPLDGGRIIKELLQIQCGLKESAIYTNKISNIIVILFTIVSSIAIYYYKNIAILFIVSYLWILVVRENKKHIQKMKIYDILENEKSKIESIKGNTQNETITI